MYQSFYPAHLYSFFNIQGQAVWPVELTYSVFLQNIQSSWDNSAQIKEEVAVDTWSEWGVPPPWGSEPTHDAGRGNEVTWVPRGGTAAQPSALITDPPHNWTDATQKSQLRANSCRYLDLSSQMTETPGADTLLRSFFGWRNQTLFGVQRSAPLPLLVSLFRLRGTAVLAAW